MPTPGKAAELERLRGLLLEVLQRLVGYEPEALGLLDQILRYLIFASPREIPLGRREIPLGLRKGNRNENARRGRPHAVSVSPESGALYRKWATFRGRG